MPRRATLRASDEDRERVAESLRRAAAEGRLLAHELEERLATALRARTYGELDSVVADLPSSRIERRRPASLRRWILPAAALAIAIPVALAAVVAIVFVVTTVLAMWALWLFVGWWLFARGRYHGRRRRRPGNSRQVGIGVTRRPQARPGFWL